MNKTAAVSMSGYSRFFLYNLKEDVRDFELLAQFSAAQCRYMSCTLQVFNENSKVSGWAARNTKCRNSGLSVWEWCSTNHLCTQTYYRWQKQLFEMAHAQQLVQFADVTLVRPVACGNVAVTIRIVGAEADIHS